MEASPLHRPRSRRLAVALPLALLLAGLVPASATLSPADASERLTYFLHSDAPVGNADMVAEFAAAQAEAGAPTPATMDETAPAPGVAKTARASSFGATDFRKNLLLAFWTGEAMGGVSELRADIHVLVDQEANLTATLFGDGGVGSGAPFALEMARVPAGGPHHVVFDFADARANLAGEIVLSIGLDLAAQPFGAAVLYDSAAFPSSLTFTLGDFFDVPPPPPRLPAAGWQSVEVASTLHAHRETSLALSPTDPDLLFACSPSGVPNTQYGHSFFHVSRDGGASWEYLEVEPSASDPRRFAFEGGDCDVAFDDAGTMYAADTWLGSLSIGASRDGGATWTGTALAASAPIVDRPWIVGGPEGVLHATWQDVQALMPSVIWYARSEDFGLTFTPAVPVATAALEGAFTWQGNLVVSPDQSDLYLVYTRRAGPNDGLDDNGPESVWVAASHDGGATWSQHLVASMPNPASYLYPSVALDTAGQLHVVFASRTSVDRPIWYARSVDQGEHWSAPIKLLAGAAGYAPWVVGAGAGEAAIAWYGTLDPNGNTSAEFDWYFFTARVRDGVVASAGPTTTTPIFSGIQSATPEFNQLRLDADGKIHLGQSAYLEDPNGGVGWAIFYQREA